MSNFFTWLSAAPMPVQLAVVVGFTVLAAFAFRDESIHGVIVAWIKKHFGSDENANQ